MPTLYHHSMSTASRFIRLVLSEYGFQTDLVEEQTWEKRKEFLAFNPAGTLPVYVDDNMRALCGPIIISEFIDETHGVLKRDRRLFAEDPFERAEEENAMGYQRWYMDRMFLIAPAGAYVGQWLQSFKEFPPRQKPGSFNLDRVMEAVTKPQKN